MRPSLALVRAHVLVSGKVQGVFFRDTTKTEAEKRGVSGWVRNLRDGRVEAVFEGDARAVDEMVAWCRVGSPLSRPTYVDRRTEPEEGLAGFRILASAERDQPAASRTATSDTPSSSSHPDTPP